MNEHGWIEGRLGVRGHPQCLVLNLEGCYYIQQEVLTLTENCILKNQTFKVCLSQTAPPKMAAMTMESYQVSGEQIFCLCIYRSNLGFYGFP